jgi:Domain of unknown function (DUF4410)
MRRLTVVLLMLVAACARVHVATVQSTPAAFLPPPSRVVVYDFAISPDQVKLDAGIGAALMRSGQSAAALQWQAAEETQAALAQTLTNRLLSYGLPVEHLAPGVPPPPNSVLVQGQIVSVNEGNRTRRTLVGFGAGESQIEADAQLYRVDDPAQPAYLAGFTGSADSGRMPGAAETMGAGAVADRLATSTVMAGATHAGAESRRTGNEALADKLANALAHQIGRYAAAQGWVPASAVE